MKKIMSVWPLLWVYVYQSWNLHPFMLSCLLFRIKFFKETKITSKALGKPSKKKGWIFSTPLLKKCGFWVDPHPPSVEKIHPFYLFFFFEGFPNTPLFKTYGYFLKGTFSVAEAMLQLKITIFTTTFTIILHIWILQLLTFFLSINW